MEKDTADKYVALGFDESLVPVIQKAGYIQVQQFKDAKAQKVRQDLGDVNKKFKLELELPSVADIESYLAKLNLN